MSAKRLKNFLIALSFHFSLQLKITTNTYTYMLQPEDIKKNEFYFEDTYKANVIIRNSSRCYKILVCANHSVKSWWRKCVVKRERWQIYVCEQFCNRLQLSKIKTRNVMTWRKMNITNEYDRPDSCLILFSFPFCFILTF